MSDTKFTLYVKGAAGIAILLSSSWRVGLGLFGHKTPFTEIQEFFIVGLIGLTLSYFLTKNKYDYMENENITKN